MNATFKLMIHSTLKYVNINYTLIHKQQSNFTTESIYCYDLIFNYFPINVKSMKPNNIIESRRFIKLRIVHNGSL